MKLIAKVTLVTPAGEIPPGGELDIKNDTEAQSLIERGLAAEARKPAAKAKGKGEADAASDAQDGAAQ